MAPADDQEVRALTVRLPPPEYDAVRAFAYYTNTSMNDVVVKAVRTFLTEKEREGDIDAHLERARAVIRDVVERFKS